MSLPTARPARPDLAARFPALAACCPGAIVGCQAQLAVTADGAGRALQTSSHAGGGWIECPEQHRRPGGIGIGCFKSGGNRRGRFGGRPQERSVLACRVPSFHQLAAESCHEPPVSPVELIVAPETPRIGKNHPRSRASPYGGQALPAYWSIGLPGRGVQEPHAMDFREPRAVFPTVRETGDTVVY